MKHISQFLDETFEEWFEERAAIIEYEANQTRSQAEQSAMAEIRRKVDQDKVANK